MSKGINRRHLLGSGAALGLPLFPGWQAFAASKVVVATWGGDNERAIRESAGRALERARGTAAIFDTGTPSARKTKLLAESGRPKSSIDIVHLTDSDMYQMQRQKLLVGLTAAMIPGFDKILPQFRTDYSVPTNFSALVLVYNKKHISSMTSWKDLWKKEYRGKVGFTDLSYDKIIPIVATAFGGSAGNYAPGYEALLELKGGARIYPSNEAVGNAFASEEIVAAIQWKGRAVQWSQAGLPLAYAVPSEGAYPTSFDMGIVKNSGNQAEAAAFLELILQPTSQLALAKAIGQAPVVSGADLPKDLEKIVGFSEKERDGFIKLDHEYTANHASEALDWWNQKFKS